MPLICFLKITSCLILATEFAPLSDAIKSGLSTCVSDSNFPTGGRKKRERLSKIVGGVNAEEGSWPWITRFDNRKNETENCDFVLACS